MLVQDSVEPAFKFETITLVFFPDLRQVFEAVYFLRQRVQAPRLNISFIEDFIGKPL